MNENDEHTHGFHLKIVIESSVDVSRGVCIVQYSFKILNLYMYMRVDFKKFTLRALITV